MMSRAQSRTTNQTSPYNPAPTRLPSTETNMVPSQSLTNGSKAMSATGVNHLQWARLIPRDRAGLPVGAHMVGVEGMLRAGGVGALAEGRPKAKLRLCGVHDGHHPLPGGTQLLLHVGLLTQCVQVSLLTLGTRDMTTITTHLPFQHRVLS